MFRLLSAARRAPLAPIVLSGWLSFAALVLPTGCAASAHRELAPDAVDSAVEARAAGPLAVLAPEQLAGLDVLALPRPTPEECADPASAGYWRACALAWNPEVRGARRDLERALANAGVAAKPGSVGLGAEALELGDLEREAKLAMTFDLLGVLGVGAVRAERALARGEVLRMRSALESAVWNAMFDVERARVRLAAGRERARVLDALAEQADAQAQRFAILERRGRLSEADARMVAASSHELAHAVSLQHSAVAEAQAELARASGLPVKSAAYAAIGAAAQGERPRALGAVERRDLLVRSPFLRELALGYAEAELRVRRAAADAWPQLRAGPKLTLVPSELLLGGVLDLAVPWPGRVAQEVAVLGAEREKARETLEDALQQAEARVASLRVVAAEARLRASEHAVELDQAAEIAWQAANARLRAGMGSAVEWLRVLRERAGALTGLGDEREAAALATLDFEEACGIARASEVQP